ncbi:hypothetical protein KHC28_00415 [Ancylobacter sonchi]|uniref:hypothetical protein n=1 Tax=Ancylobacter sonchi TaxID=1937790 RepID=UPI001BD3EEA2|nr:hypothetical protein [Ancylobacter sonchi]MBS7532128.1 hypothetical protein [Ancylobacter sonchi]
MKLSSLKSGVKKSTIGAWVRDIPIDGMQDLALKVRGNRNIDAQRMRGDLLAALPDDERKDLPAAKSEEIALTVLSEAVLVDWNLTDDDGEAIPFSPEAAREIMTDPDIGSVFRDAVAYAGAVVAERGAENLEADVKN